MLGRKTLRINVIKEIKRVSGVGVSAIVDVKL